MLNAVRPSLLPKSTLCDFGQGRRGFLAVEGSLYRAFRPACFLGDFTPWPASASQSYDSCGVKERRHGVSSAVNCNFQSPRLWLFSWFACGSQNHDLFVSQRDHGIDAHRTPPWDVASERSRDHHEQCRPGDGERIVWFNSIKVRGDQPRRRQGDGNA